MTISGLSSLYSIGPPPGTSADGLSSAASSDGGTSSHTVGKPVIVDSLVLRLAVEGCFTELNSRSKTVMITF